MSDTRAARPIQTRRTFISLRLARIILAACLSAMLLLGAAPAFASATIWVNSSGDGAPADDGVCTLREAITAANTDAAYHDCAAGSGDDTILFTVDFSGQSDYTITLDGGQGQLPDITSNITISGLSASTMIVQANASDSNSYRVFEVDSGGTLTLNNLTVRGGNCTNSSTSLQCPDFQQAGAGILNAGALTLNNSVVRDNVAASGSGITSYGTLTLNATTVSDNTGLQAAGIDNFPLSPGPGIAHITDSTIGGAGHGNTAAFGSGGGINNDGTMTIDHSTVAGNSAFTTGGGVTNFGALTIQNNSVIGGSSAAGNTATGNGGGVFAAGGTTTIDHSSVTGNSAASGGGVYVNLGATLTAQNTAAIGAVGAPNHASVNGGGIGSEGTAALSGARVSANTASGSGGGIYNKGSLSLTSGTSVGGVGSGNSAASGGGVYLADGSATIDGSFIGGNTASVSGGGIYALTSLTITAAQIGGTGMGNTAPAGGGLTVHAGATSIDGSLVGNNTASAGSGGGLRIDGGSLTVTATRLLNNSASAGGGGVYNDVNAAALSVTGSCIVGNSATAFLNNQPAQQTATGNWWGAPDGPGPVGPGVGDTASAAVDFSSTLAADPNTCGSTARQALQGGKSFGVSTLVQGATTTATIHIHNPNTIALTGIHFTDSLPAQLKAVAPTDGSQCGGTVSIANPAQIAFVSGSLAADDGAAGGPDECDIVVTVQAAGGGLATNPAFAIQRDHIPDGATTPVSITVRTLAAAPVLTTPKNGAPVYTHTVKLAWKKAKGALGYHLLLEDITDLLNPTQVAQPDVLKGTGLTTPTLGFGLYRWQVASGTAAAGYGAYSAPFTFEVTLNKTPKKNAALKNGVVKFAWLAVKGKTYLLRITDETAHTVTYQTPSPLSKPAFTVDKTAPLPSGSYSWQVSIDGGSSWTLAWGFTVP